MDQTSLSLLDRVCRSRDSESWSRLFELYAPLLKRWLARYDVQAADADDLVQEVLAVVMRELPQFQHNQRTGAFRSWLRTILVHRLRDFWRSRNYRPVAMGRTDFARHLDELADPRSSLTRTWDREHDEFVMKQLMQAVRPRFEPKTWQAFRLQVVDGRRADAVAHELGLSLASVYMAKSRVLHALRRESQGLTEGF